MKLFLTFGFCIGLCLGAGHGNNPCEEGLESSAECLEYIKSVGYDDERFFFGSSYKESCEFDYSSVDCYNPFYDWTNSISSIIFRNGETALDGIDRFLHVEFASEPFEYHGCGTHVQVPEVEFSLDMSLHEHEPATARELNGMAWEYDEGDMFTVIAIDPGFSALHMMAVNIPGNDMTQAEVIREYSGPLNYRYVPNPYVFLLFKQNSAIQISDDWMGLIYARQFVTQIPEFMANYNLMGPVAMNILLASTDPYAVESLQSFAGDLIQNCAIFVERELQRLDEPFLDGVDFDLTAFLNVTIRSDYDSFFYCCETHESEKQAVQLDPISNKIITASSARSGSDVTIIITPNVLPPTISEVLLSMRFTVIALDPDVPFSAAGTQERPLLHYFAYNVHVEQLASVMGVLKGGNTLLEWSGPMPPDDLPHSYYFLMLWQPREFYGDDDVSYLDYTGADCNEGLRTRCLFDIRRFINDKGLALVGASWFRSYNDDFVNYNRGTPEEEACGERYPCALPPTVSKAPVKSSIDMAPLVIVALLAMLY